MFSSGVTRLMDLIIASRRLCDATPSNLSALLRKYLPNPNTDHVSYFAKAAGLREFMKKMEPGVVTRDRKMSLFAFENELTAIINPPTGIVVLGDGNSSTVGWWARKGGR